MTDIANKDRFYSAQEICELCGVTKMTFSRFVDSDCFTSNTDVTREEMRGKHKNVKTTVYSTKVLEAFQIWLEKNAINQGKTSNTVKENLVEQVKIGSVVNLIQNTGDVKAAEELCNLIMCNARNKANALEAANKVKELTPKAEFYDAVANSESLLIMREVCKVLGLKYGDKTLYKHLVELKILMPNHEPYQKFVKAGLFKVCESQITDSSGNVRVMKTTKVYQKGVDYIRNKLIQNNLLEIRA